MTNPPRGESLSHTRLVRPYMVTRGRTTVSDLPIETMVKSQPDVPATGLTDEAREVYAASPAPIAIAELSAKLQLPVGITRVVVADLMDSGHLVAFETASSDDVTVVTRILNALTTTGGAS